MGEASASDRRTVGDGVRAGGPGRGFGYWAVAQGGRRVQIETNNLILEREKAEERRRRPAGELAGAGELHARSWAEPLCPRRSESRSASAGAALELAEEPRARGLGRVARVNLAVWHARLVTPRGLLHHDGWAWAVAFSPDSRTALTGGKDCVARRWDTRTGLPIDEPLRTPRSRLGGFVQPRRPNHFDRQRQRRIPPRGSSVMGRQDGKAARAAVAPSR